jgi:hypothetical protein
MNDREKLIKLIQSAVDGCAEYWAGLIADHLIANGVTVQQWISVTESLPEQYETVVGWTKYREMGEVSHNGKRFVWESDDGDYAHVTHWMPLPEPPKGESHEKA